MPNSDISVRHGFLDRNIHVPSFVAFATELVSANDLQNDPFFTEHNADMTRIASGHELLTSDDLDVVKMKKYCFINFLPVFAHAQGVEISMKDAVRAKKTEERKKWNL